MVIHWFGYFLLQYIKYYRYCCYCRYSGGRWGRVWQGYRTSEYWRALWLCEAYTPKRITAFEWECTAFCIDSCIEAISEWGCKLDAATWEFQKYTCQWQVSWNGYLFMIIYFLSRKEVAHKLFPAKMGKKTSEIAKITSGKIVLVY